MGGILFSFSLLTLLGKGLGNKMCLYALGAVPGKPMSCRRATSRTVRRAGERLPPETWQEVSWKDQASLVQESKAQDGAQEGLRITTAPRQSPGGCGPVMLVGICGPSTEPGRTWSSPTYLVLGVEDDSLGVGHADHVVVEAGSGQPDAGGELMVEQGEL